MVALLTWSYLPSGFLGHLLLMSLLPVLYSITLAGHLFLEFWKDLNTLCFKIWVVGKQITFLLVKLDWFEEMEFSCKISFMRLTWGTNISL